jgi:hypothetical protein
VESLEERTVLAGAVDFAPPQTFGSGGVEARFVGVGDFNNDGTPDLVAAGLNFDEHGTNTLGVLLAMASVASLQPCLLLVSACPGRSR